MTAIEWADESWNIFYGCRRRSAGCGTARAGGCYAERQMIRLGGYRRGIIKRTKNGPRFTGEVELLPERLEQPLRWRKPRRVFVESMGDLFYEGVPEEYIDRVFGVIAECYRRGKKHVFIILSKREDRMPSYMRTPGRAERVGAPCWPLPNVVLMVSAEDQEQAVARVPALLQAPAVCRGVSYEPMLGPVDVRPWLAPRSVSGRMVPRRYARPAPSLDWIICGHESGPRLRTASLDWVRSVRDQIDASSGRCALFFKQWHESGKKISAPYLDGVQHLAEPAIFKQLEAA